MQKADYLLRLIKQQTDALVAKDEKLQQFLMWVNQKSLSVSVPYKPVVIRAVYVAIAVARDLGLPFDPDRSRDIAFVFNLDVYSNNDFDIALDYNLSRLLVRISDFYFALDQHNYEMIGSTDHALYMLFANIFALNLPLELRQALEKVKEQRHQRGYNIFSKMWWQPNKIWIKRLRDVMIKHRNIGHNWQFSKEQKELLKQYYYANLLLVDCLNNNSDVIPAVRSHIEDTLLLPIAEIEKHK
jgi:hypothetical protein